MLARTIGFSIRQRWLVLAVVALLCAIGAWSATKLPIDAVPDITNVQVQINTKAEGYSPLEAEQRLQLLLRRVTLEAPARAGKLHPLRAKELLLHLPALTRHLEAAYAAMVARREAGLPPDHIRVPRSAANAAPSPI